MSAITNNLNTEFIDTLDHHDAVDQLKLLNRGQGFVITIERTKQDKTALKQTRKVFLRCWKSRPYKSTSTGARRSSTRSTECPWRGCLTRDGTGWRVEVKHAEHNHELDRVSPERTILRRQKPVAPLRALASLTPYSVPGAPPTQPTPASAPPGYAPAAPPQPYYPLTPQQYPPGQQALPSFHQFPPMPAPPQPIHPQHQPLPNMPDFFITTPQGTQTPPAPPPSQTQKGKGKPPPPHANAPTYAGKGPQRRRGFAVLSEIPVRLSYSLLSDAYPFPAP